MPIYEYRCGACGTEFEKRVARAEDSSTVPCPSCGENHLTPRFSTFAAVTNGAGSRDSAPACPSAGSCPNSGMCGIG